jgi:hypothetical protein
VERVQDIAISHRKDSCDLSCVDIHEAAGAGDSALGKAYDQGSTSIPSIFAKVLYKGWYDETMNPTLSPCDSRSAKRGKGVVRVAIFSNIAEAESEILILARHSMRLMP